MKTIGTALEWFKTKPEAYIRLPKMQKGTCIKISEYHPKGQMCTYMSLYADGPPMLPYFGNQCPYVNKGKQKFFGTAYGPNGGCTTVISEGDAFRPEWYEVDVVECIEQFEP